MNGCATCNTHAGNAYYARGDLGDAKGKFIRRQNKETHAALVAAKETLKAVHAEWDQHVAAEHAEVSA